MCESECLGSSGCEPITSKRDGGHVIDDDVHLNEY